MDFQLPSETSFFPTSQPLWPKGQRKWRESSENWILFLNVCTATEGKRATYSLLQQANYLCLGWNGLSVQSFIYIYIYTHTYIYDICICKILYMCICAHTQTCKNHGAHKWQLEPYFPTNSILFTQVNKTSFCIWIWKRTKDHSGHLEKFLQGYWDIWHDL